MEGAVVGNYVYFSRQQSGTGAPWTLSRVAVLGGIPEKRVVDVDSPVTFSPDGHEFAFVRLHEGRTDLRVVRSDGTVNGCWRAQQCLDSSLQRGPAGLQMETPAVIGSNLSEAADAECGVDNNERAAKKAKG